MLSWTILSEVPRCLLLTVSVSKRVSDQIGIRVLGGWGQVLDLPTLALYPLSRHTLSFLICKHVQAHYLLWSLPS